MKYLTKNILPFLFLVLTVSPVFFVYEDLFLLPFTVILIIGVFLRKKKIDHILYFIIVYWVIINLFAFTVFRQSFSATAYTFFGSLMRIILAYMILKFCGYNLFFNAEKIAFILICIGLPIFFLTQYSFMVFSLLKHLDFGSMDRQALDGGWNILVFNYNPWAGFRFSGFAWEPGACALIIIFCLVICTYRDGFGIDYRKIIYSISLIFTFSTAGYLAFGILVLIYAINIGRKSIKYLLVVLLFLIPLARFAYKQDFMSGKIDSYLKHNERVIGKGLEDKGYTSLSRLDAVYMGLILVKEWPLGFGVLTKGRILNKEGSALYGANALIEIAIKWGLLGFIFFIFSFYRYSYIYYLMNEKNKSYLLLLIPLLIMFFSNPVERTPLVFGLVFYPYMYGRYFKQYMNLKNFKIA